MIDLLFVVQPGVLLLDLAGPADAFRLANEIRRQQGRPPCFRLRFVGPDWRSASSVGVALTNVEPLPEPLQGPTWVVLMGVATPLAPDGAGLEDSRAWLTVRDWLSRTVHPALGAALPGPGDSAGAGLLSVCSGALMAADAGLLAGRRCTTHHELLDVLARRAAASEVLAHRVFVEDGPVASSAGITAGIDLALHLVARVCGDACAAQVARAMVVYLRRGPEDPQLSPLLAWRNHLHPALHRVQDAVCQQPAHAWDAQSLAAVAHVSPRHLARLFREQAGISARGYVESIRCALAAEAIERGLSVEAASARAGFSSARQWRRARARLEGQA